jgi:hypothetical protein
MKAYESVNFAVRCVARQRTEVSNWRFHRIEWPKTYEHSEQARVPLTNGPRDVPRRGALSLLQRRCTTRGVDRGAQAIVRGDARCASQVLHRCAQAVSRGAARCTSQVLGQVAQPMPSAPCMYLIVQYRPFPAAPLVVRCMYMAVVPGPMPAAVASRCCRRRFQQLACA